MNKLKYLEVYILRLIYKFGGSSLATVEKIKKIANFIKETKKRDNLELIVVVSAMGKTTNKLIKLANNINQATTSTAYSSLISLGENISAYALSLALDEINIKNIPLTSKDIKIHAEGSTTNGIITYIDKAIIEENLQDNKVVIVTGFQCVNSNNELLTLGRGGSDTTAVALGVTFNAPVKIFTDVDGYYSLDPNKYNKPKKIKSINISSAIELASLGSKVLDYRCLNLSNKYHTPISVGNTQSQHSFINFNKLENFSIDGISTKNNVTFVKNTSKNQHFLHTTIQNCNYKTYFYQQNNSQNQECWFTDAKANIINILAKANNYKNITATKCELLILAGSGLTTHKDFIEKVQKTLLKNKIKHYHISLTQTTLIIATKINQAKNLEFLLAKEFNLFKEK